MVVIRTVISTRMVEENSIKGATSLSSRGHAHNWKSIQLIRKAKNKCVIVKFSLRFEQNSFGKWLHVPSLRKAFMKLSEFFFPLH